MKRLRRGASGLARFVTWPVRRLGSWWNGLLPPERVLYRAIGLLAIGSAMVAPALAFIVPGLLFALVFFDFSFHRRGS